MEPQTTPPQKTPPKYLKIAQADLDRIAARKTADEAKLTVDDEWLAIARFGKHYGWAAVQSVLRNEITLDLMMTLLAAAEKVESGNTYRMAQATLIGVAAANAKKPSQVFKSATSEIVKNGKADE